jgi:Arc/MetJ family transcription regulator
MYKRTNVEIDIDLVKDVIETYRLKSIKETVVFCLEKSIEVKKKRRDRLKLRGKVQWEGNLSEMREMR